MLSCIEASTLDFYRPISSNAFQRLIVALIARHDRLDHELHTHACRSNSQSQSPRLRPHTDALPVRGSRMSRMDDTQMTQHNAISRVPLVPS
ncbi:hypothetical protein C8Q70DRAFT_615280 [Cubamyces menziesii]|nr:hypothetical protein C8Q70DRAFT_615280 [Cubamyces menziesii]